MRKETPRSADSLRKRAEGRLPENEPANSVVIRDPAQLAHELSVHQMELEMQNEELRRVQGELEEARAKYFDLYEFAPVGYCTLGENGRILEANLSLAGLLGTEKRHLLNKGFSNFVAPEFQDAFYFHCKSVAKSRLQQACELKLLKAGRDSFYAHLESLPIQNAVSGSCQIRLSIIDIDERKRGTLVRQEKARQNELLLNLLPHPAMLVGKDRKVLAANKLARRCGAELGGLWMPDTHRIKAPAEGKGAHDKSRKKTSTDVLKIAVRALPQLKTRLDERFFEGIFCLTDGEQNQERLVTVVEDSNDAVTVLDFEGHIKAWNHGAEKVYGYPASQALKMKIFDLIPPGKKREMQSLLNDIQSGVLVPPFETRRVARDGCLLDIRLTVTRLIQDGQIVAVATTERDVTEYNRWLSSIKALPHRIILAREEERSRISQEIHSDFSQSLLALKMFVTMSAADVPVDALPTQLVLEQIKRRLTVIIEQARNLSHKLAPPSLKYVGLVESIRKLISSSTSAKSLNVHFFHRNMRGVTFGAKDIIVYRIVQEALLNTLKHAKATQAWIKIHFRNSAVSLEIRDNGRGFGPAKPHQARGLGLELLREQAVLVHASINILSKIGKGTVVQVTIPVRERKLK